MKLTIHTWWSTWNVGFRKSEQCGMPEEFRWNLEMLQNIRFTPWKPTPGKSAQVVGRNMYITERMIDAHGTTDNCRKCSTGQENHSAECRQRFEKIQYDLLQEKLRQAPVLPEDSGDQTVVTPAPAASSSSPSAEERIRQKRAGLHGPEQESVTASASNQDVRMGDAVSPRSRIKFWKIWFRRGYSSGEAEACGR